MAQIIRVVEDGVEFFTVQATGESGMSQSGLAILCGVSKQAISKLVLDLSSKVAPKRLQPWIGKDICFALTAEKRGGKLKIFKMVFALDVIRHFYAEGKCTVEGCKLVGMPPLRTNKKRYAELIEGKYRDRLAIELNGETEVVTPAGRIDVLTPTEIIEVKDVCGWKQAIGQVLVYGKYYPTHKKRIHLFGGISEAQIKLIHSHVNDLGIILTWEQ
ncbi:MAG: hypothetical protein ACM37W_19920 [Actinomycetota bacterium]